MRDSAAGLSVTTTIFTNRSSKLLHIAFLSWQASHQLRQALEDSRSAQPLPIVDGRVTTDDFPCGNIIGNARLRGRDYSVADMAVAGNAHLTRENNVTPDLRRAGKPHLRT